MADSFTLLVICTGNICRSPAAALMLAAGFGPDSGVTVRSAGTGAREGAVIDEYSAQLLRQDGIDPSGHRAHWLTAADVEQADVVIGLTREHRSAAVALTPSAVRRSFTLRGLADLAGRVSPQELGSEAGIAERMRAFVAAAPRYRRRDLDEDIEDPYGRDLDVYRSVHAEIAAATAALVAAVRPSD